MNGALPAVATFVPLGAAVALGGFGGKARRWFVDAFAIGAAAATLALNVALLLQARHHRVIHWFSGWKAHRGVALGVAFTVDQITAGTAALVAALGFVGLLFSWRYLDSGKNHFHVLMFLFEGGMIGFALSGDFFIMFVFFELMSVAAYALTGMKVSEPGPLQGAVNFAIINSIGSFAFLLGIGLLYGRTGALNFAQIGTALARHHATDLVIVALALVIVGLLVKAAVVPFHFWLADAHAVAPTPACVLFSGVMVMLGLYGVARVYWTVFQGSIGDAQHSFGLVLIGAGVASIIVGSVMSFVQQHLKRLLAFSTIAHAGIALVGIGLMSADGLAGAALYVAGHGMVKAALFVLAGVLLHRFGSVDEVHLQGRGGELWLTGGLFALGGLALAGLPPFGTQLGKGVVEDASGYPWLPWLFAFAGLMTGAAVLRATGRIFLGWGPKPRHPSRRTATWGEEDRETTSAFGRTPAVLIAPAVLLLAAGVAIGVWPHAAEDTQVAAARFQDRKAYTAAVLDHRDTAQSTRTTPPSWAGVWYGLAGAGGAAGLAAVTLFRRRVSARVRRALRPALTPVLALREVHTGHIGDYAMWFTVGLAAFGGLLVLAIR